MSFWFFTSYRAWIGKYTVLTRMHTVTLQTLHTERKSTCTYIDIHVHVRPCQLNLISSTHTHTHTHRGWDLGQLTCLNETGLRGGYWRMGGLVRIWERGLGCTSSRPSSPNQPAPCSNIPTNTHTHTHIHTVGSPKRTVPQKDNLSIISIPTN